MGQGMKRLCATALTGVLCTGLISQGGVVWEEEVSAATTKAATPAVTEIPGTTKTEKEIDGSFLSVTGFAKGKVSDRSGIAEGDSRYAVVKNEEEFLEALMDARSDGAVKVIELQADMYLGWNELSDKAKASGLIEPCEGSETLVGAPISNPSMIESGISCLTLDEINGLTIFSRTGHTIRHAEIKLNSGVNDMVIRNIRFTDTFDWDDKRSSGYGETGSLGSAKRTGATYLKVNGAHNIWIDHCTFGISYDGDVDFSNGASGVSMTWCNIGDVDYSKGSMLYKTISYLETLYQQNKTNSEIGTFIIYSIMRDNGMTQEDISKYMGYHKKAHLCGDGDKDTWLYRDDDNSIKADTEKTDANELIRLTFAYNNWTNIGSRVPMVRGGVAHLFNCFTDDTKMCEAGDIINSDPLKTGKNIREQVNAKGGSIHLLTRGIDARNGASIAADTNVYYNIDEPIIGDEENVFEGNDAKFNGLFPINHALIVNSKVKRPNKSDYYTGSSWDNNGVNDFTKGYNWKDKSTINNWSWGQEGDKLSYEYQTFALDKVEENVKKYGGAYTMDMSAADWLKTEYSADTQLKVVDKTKTVPIETISLSKTETTLYVEEEFLQLDARVTPSHTTETAASFTWTSSNPDAATVNDCGLVIPKDTGDTTITVETAGGLKATCEVHVEHLPTGVTITGIPKTIYVGDEFQLNAVITPAAVTDASVTWASMDNSIELVDADKGIFRAVKAGKNKSISATTNMRGNRAGSEGITKIAKVTIKDNPAPSNQPEASKTPVSSENPVTSDTPIASNTPQTSDMPQTSNAPQTSEEPLTSQVPSVTHQPGITTPPSTAPLKKGDVNNDDTITLKDAQTVLKFALKLKTPDSEMQKEAADVNEDGEVNLKDAQLILKFALKLITSFNK